MDDLAGVIAISGRDLENVEAIIAITAAEMDVST